MVRDEFPELQVDVIYAWAQGTGAALPAPEADGGGAKEEAASPGPVVARSELVGEGDDALLEAGGERGAVAVAARVGESGGR